jgi:hypothetical protein
MPGIKIDGTDPRLSSAIPELSHMPTATTGTRPRGGNHQDTPEESVTNHRSGRRAVAHHRGHGPQQPCPCWSTKTPNTSTRPYDRPGSGRLASARF